MTPEVVRRIILKKGHVPGKSSRKEPRPCPACGAIRIVYKHTSKDANCRSCAQFIEKNKPDWILKLSVRSKEQVIRQGGIPNAVKFTKGSTAGPLNTNWKGGITPEKIRLRVNNDRLLWVKATLKRDDYTCQICSSRSSGNLHVHHIKKFSDYPELRYDPNNGMTLCKDCHKEIVHRGAWQYEPMTLSEIRELQSMPVSIDWEPARVDLLTA